ncbi:MAG: DUF1963 domain-containing protein [Paludibacteraceae bacterium]|nr:DUF1963 domain-containing protein [Paludibacteraceae bacterium]
MDEKDQYYIQIYVYAGVLIAAAIYLLFKSIYETGLIQYLAKKIIGEYSVEKIKQQLYNINDETTIYRKKKKNVDIQKEMELTKKVLAEMDKETVKPVLRLKLTNEQVSISGSKVGGIPYIPSKEAIPFDSEGMPLRMLAQIDCRLLSALPDFPQVGLLQFWIGQDESLGLFTKGGSKVIWHETIDSQITEEQVSTWLAELPQPSEESWFPVGSEYGVSFTKDEEPMSMEDVHFEPIFVKKYNALNESDPIEGIYDLSEEAYEIIEEKHIGEGHKIGGYPHFEQEDPREEKSKQTVLLLQIDSEYSEETPVEWGDAGVCGFFCTPENLKRRNFSKVLYNWDCS